VPLIVEQELNTMAGRLDNYLVTAQPYYSEQGNEVLHYEKAYARRLPVLLKGPTGVGKTRFIEYMAHRLKRPLITVACNEDMTASDLVGRYLLDSSGLSWQDGPLAQAVRHGAICYLDEVIEARQDTTVIIHPLTDSRRILPVDKKGEVIHAHPDFQLVVSYNPGYQSHSKDMKPSTRQRFVALSFDYPDPEAEAQILVQESDVNIDIARSLVSVGQHTRALTSRGLAEGASTRMLVYAAFLIRDGMLPADSCEMTLVQALTDDPDLTLALQALIKARFG
jgi:nitric oxide reductase NorQ protein